jgi:hypothetical protein
MSGEIKAEKRNKKKLCLFDEHSGISKYRNELVS